ncbi:MAG: hypothetical protein JSV96_10555 [Candidatus Aminicenantes bacterium]|nr:MAG: hypothetical protein JSV96_10555 [Candidatus Aminicenantes bacterium]
MQKTKENKQVFQVLCPICKSLLWIDPVTEEIIQFEEKAGKKRKSLEELLLKEKKKKKEADRRFEATAELEKKRSEEAEDKFKKALSEMDKK